MKVNRNYYPTSKDIEYKKGDTVIATGNGPLNYNDYPANFPLDNSATYVKAKSTDLPCSRFSVVTPSRIIDGAETATTFYNQKIQLTSEKYLNLLGANNWGFGNVIEERYFRKLNGTTGYEYGYNIDTSTTSYIPYNICVATSFSFTAQCAYISITATKYPNSNVDLHPEEFFNGGFSEWDSTAFPYVSGVVYCPSITKYNSLLTARVYPFAQLSFKNYDYNIDRAKYDDDYTVKHDTTTLLISNFGVDNAAERNGIILFGEVLSPYNAYKPLKNNPQTNYGDPFFFIGYDYVTNKEFVKKDGSYYDFRISSNTITKELIEKWANAFGLYWAEDWNTAKTADLGKDCTNPKVHLPIIDENGVTTGKDETGKNTTKLPQSGWSNPDDVFNKNPVRPDDDNDYTTNQELNKPSVSPIGSFTRTYAISGENVKLLSDKIWSGDDTAFKTFIDGLALMGENPINSIIDIRFYPFEIPNLGASNKIVLGRNNTGIVGYPLASVDNNIITFGTAKILEKYNCFLDYPPYTKAELVIPNVGSVDLDLTKVMGKNIKLQVIVDYVTGACTAVVFADNTIIHTLAGTIAIEVPVTGTNSAQYASSVTNSLLSLPSSIGSAATGISSGNAAQAVSGITGTLGAVGNIISTPLPITSKNSATPMCSLFLPQYAYIRVTRPTFEEPDTYKRTFGYACNLSKRLGDMSGYVVCQNPILNNSFATNEEIDQIIGYLESGVIV